MQLLADIRDLFESEAVDRLPSYEIAEALGMMEERPWPEWRGGKPLTIRQLAALLKPFDIRPKTLRFERTTAKGYLRESFKDAFSRYLPESIRNDRNNSLESTTYEVDRSVT